MCESCFHIQKRYRKSKCNECSSFTFEVDELIAPVIQVLNRKGYRTIYCCSGHPEFWKNTFAGTYIMFSEPYHKLETFYFPKDFFMDDDESKEKNTILRGMGLCYSNPKYYDSYGESIVGFANSIKNLNDWANALEDRSEKVGTK